MVKDLGREETLAGDVVWELGAYFKVVGGQVAACSKDQDSGELVCDEANKKDLAYFRLTEGIQNTAIITAVDVNGSPIEETFGSQSSQ